VRATSRAPAHAPRRARPQEATTRPARPAPPPASPGWAAGIPWSWSCGAGCRVWGLEVRVQGLTS